MGAGIHSPPPPLYVWGLKSATPSLLEGKHFKPYCLPPVEATDLSSYLVLETSYYTQKQFKSFKSLEAYDRRVSGFITSVEGHNVANKLVVLAKVRHSQCMNDTLIPTWIITEREGTILSAHCLGFKAGLAESCSHITSVFFLSRGLDKEKWSAFVYPGQMQVTFAIICQANRLCQGSWHKLYIGKEDEIWLGCEHWQCLTWSFCCKKNCHKKSQPHQKQRWTSSSLKWARARISPSLPVLFQNMLNVTFARVAQCQQ